MNENCEKHFDLIEKLFEGEECDEQFAARTESHMFDCVECRNEYELLRREKEVLARYLFGFEPPPNSWMNFQTRLVEDEKTTPSEMVAPVASPRRRKRIFVFGFSPALAAFAGLLLFFGIGFVLLRNAPIEPDEKRIAEIKSEVSPQPSTPLGETDRKSVTGAMQAKNGDDGDALKTNERLSKNQSSKSGSDSLFGKKSLAAVTRPNDEVRAATLQRRKLEIEIVEQIEKIESLLRSFRNARATENANAFDVEYEKRQARKLFATNAALRRDAESFGISYAEELLSCVEPYLLEVANLENNPAPDKVLAIKERISSQNIIANLQVYSSVAMMR